MDQHLRSLVVTNGTAQMLKCLLSCCGAVLRSFLMGVKQNCWCFSCTQSPNSAVGWVVCGEFLNASTVQGITPTMEPWSQPATLGMTECLGHVFDCEANEFSHHLAGWVKYGEARVFIHPHVFTKHPLVWTVFDFQEAFFKKPGVTSSNQTDSFCTGLELPICHSFCWSVGTRESDYSMLLCLSLFFCCKANV